MRANRLVAAVFLLLAACSSDEPTRVELVPKPVVRVAGVPEGWSGGAGPSYELGLDQTQQRNGTAAVYLTAVADSPVSFITLSQSLRADAYRGQRIRWSGWVKATAIQGGGGTLWARVDGPGVLQAYDDMSDRPITGTHDWHQVSIVVDVPENAIGLAMGARLRGSGDLLVDDFRLDIVGDEVPVTDLLTAPVPASADSAQIAAVYARLTAAPANLDFEGVTGVADATVAWVAANAVPFATVLPGSTDSDLEPLRQMVGSARVVGMGEGTHGTREFFLLKHRVFQFLVRQMGFTHFAIEATWPESKAINQYVLTGEGDPGVLLDRLYFWTWNTEEVLHLIEWMREWNATAPPGRRVQFAGFDIQYPGMAMGTVDAYVRIVDPPNREVVDDAFACIYPYRNVGPVFQALSSGYRALPAATRAACRASLQQLHDYLLARRVTYEAASSPAEFENALRSVRLVQQFEEMISETSGGALRDRFMAENTLWLLEQAGPDARMMIWAHNGHIGRLPLAMGELLDAELGSDYVNLGFLFGTGEFNARGVGSTPPRPWTVSLLPAQSLESVFDRTGQPRLLLDTRLLPGAGAAAAPLRGPILMRRVGSLFDPAYERNYFFGSLFPGDFDLLMYVEHGTATRLRSGG